MQLVCVHFLPECNYRCYTLWSVLSHIVLKLFLSYSLFSMQCWTEGRNSTVVAGDLRRTPFKWDSCKIHLFSWKIADQNFYDICFAFIYPMVSAESENCPYCPTLHSCLLTKLTGPDSLSWLKMAMFMRKEKWEGVMPLPPPNFC